MLPFDTCNWYWLKEDGMVFHSKRQRDFPPNDSAYQEWLAAGGIPRPYPKDAQGNESRKEMNRILYEYGLRVYPLTEEEKTWNEEAKRGGIKTRFAYREEHDKEIAKQEEARRRHYEKQDK